MHSPPNETRSLPLNLPGPAKKKMTNRDRQMSHEMARSSRPQGAGSQTTEDLAQHVGATYWEGTRFARALAFAVTDGLIVRTGEGTISAV